MSEFIVGLHEAGELSPTEGAILAAVGIQDGEELYALALSFPSLGGVPGVDLRKLSTLGARHSERAYASAAAAMSRQDPPTYARGAIKPPSVPEPPASIPIPSGATSAQSKHRRRNKRTSGSYPLPGGANPIDLRISSWPVRNQGARGTCVAHAVVACREHLAFRKGGAGAPVDLSEQFLFWAAKTLDQRPQDDGTLIDFARTALAHDGVCEEVHWRYDQKRIVGDVTHTSKSGPPASPVRVHAEAYRHAARHYQAGGDSAVVLRELLADRPVALTLPVYAEPLALARDNWNTSIARTYGVVLDPPPTSVFIGAHTVCVVGYVPDPSGLGGWFIFKNSWGTDWASRAPSPRRHVPEPGYGQISTFYVDEFAWEICSL